MPKNKEKASSFVALLRKLGWVSCSLLGFDLAKHHQNGLGYTVSNILQL